MGRGSVVFLVVLSIIAAKLMLRRKNTRKDLVGRVSDRMSGLSHSKPIETLLGDVEDILKEIRKQIKR